MNNKYRWNWPISGHVTAQGQEGSGLDQFSSEPLNNLAREVIQNSLDARKDDKTVEVEFSLFKTKPDSFLNISDFFLNYIKKYIDFNKDKDDSEKILMERIYSYLSQASSKNEIVWLRISDKGTTGLRGVSTPGNQDLPWFSFINGVGKSTKNEIQSGGTKGLGKNAIFVNSGVRTIFVSTKTDQNETGHIGVSKLVSLIIEDGTDNPDWTQGVGYCVLDNDEAKNKNCPTDGILDLDPSFVREKNGFGTDIYVPFFMNEESNWDAILISEAIISFMPAIIDGDLRVSVNNQTRGRFYTVDKFSLCERLNQPEYFENDRAQNIAGEIYQAIMHPHKVETYNKNKENELELRVFLNSPKSKNKIYTYRWKAKMLIKEMSVSSTLKYTAVLFMKGLDICNKIKSVEDATHRNWSKKKYKITKYQKEEISKAIDKVEGFAKEEIEKLEYGDIGEESDFNWAADEGWTSENAETLDGTMNLDSGLPSDEIVFDPPKRRKEKKKRKPLKRSATTEDESGEAENYITGIGKKSENGEFEASTPTGHNSGTDDNMHPGDNKFNAEEDEDGSLMMIRKSVGTVKSKMPVVDLSKGIFRLSFVPSRSGDDVEIEIFKSGEDDDNEKVEILAAKMNGKDLAVKGNVVSLEKIHKGEKYQIDVELKEKKIYVWEVNVNAY